MRHPSRLLACALTTLLVAGCAGFRGGWESVPYLGETPPVLAASRTPYEARKRSELTLPGMTLGVGIHNQVRTYDTQVVLFALPMSVDPRTVRTQESAPGRTRVSITVSALTADVSFRPKRARLAIGNQVVEGIAGYEFAMWDPQGNKVSSGGTWDRKQTQDELVLVSQKQTYLLHIDFPVPTPSPETRGMSLDLSEALASDQLPKIPLIRFIPMRWKEGYT